MGKMLAALTAAALSVAPHAMLMDAAPDGPNGVALHLVRVKPHPGRVG